MEPMFAGIASPAPAPGNPPFSVGRVISRTFSVWSRNALVFTGVALLINLPAIALAFAGAGLTNRGPASALKPLLENVLALVTSGALTAGVLQSLGGERPGIGRLLATGLRKAGWIFLISLGVGLLVGCGTVLLIVPGLIALSGCYVAVPAVVAERDRGGTDAISRSWELTRGRRMKVLAVALVFALGALAVTFALGALFGYAATLLTGGVGQGTMGLLEILAIVLAGIAQCAPAVTYHDLRVEKEGVSTEQLAAVFE